MRGNAMALENREKLNQAIKLLSALKDVKLRARADKYMEFYPLKTPAPTQAQSVTTESTS